MELILKPEYELTATERKQIYEIRKSCFPETNITNFYGKQLPTGRIMAFQDDELIGHIALMMRLIRINETQLMIMGIQDVVVEAEHRKKGIMTQMIGKAEALAITCECSLLMLFASEPEIYEGLGFKSVVTNMEWLKIHEGRNLGTGSEKVDETMIKLLADDVPEEINSIDMLGHIF